LLPLTYELPPCKWAACSVSSMQCAGVYARTWLFVHAHNWQDNVWSVILTKGKVATGQCESQTISLGKQMQHLTNKLTHAQTNTHTQTNKRTNNQTHTHTQTHTPSEQPTSRAQCSNTLVACTFASAASAPSLRPAPVGRCTHAISHSHEHTPQFGRS
jgi:hypothetical protein